MANGKVTAFSYQWWKNTAGGWVQPTAEELNTVLKESGFSVGDSSNTLLVDIANSGDDSGGFATSGIIVVPTQSFTTTTLIYYSQDIYVNKIESNVDYPRFILIKFGGPQTLRRKPLPCFIQTKDKKQGVIFATVGGPPT